MAEESSLRSSGRGRREMAVAKNFLHVQLSDGTEKKLDTDLTSSARVCAQVVAKVLHFEYGIDEWALRCKSGWLNLDLPLADQWNKADGPLQFRKKYFLSDASLPRTCKERSLLYYQVLQLVSSGVYVCTNLQYVKFASLAAQQRYGDRDGSRHNKAAVHEFMPEPLWTALEGHVLDAWTSLAGANQDQVVYDFTNAAQELPTYGISRFPVTEPANKDKSKRDLGVNQTHVFRIQDNVVVEQIRLEDLRTWNFTPKSIELEFAPNVREKYVANTTRGREILALLSEYQYFNRTRGGVSDSLKVNIQLSPTDEVTTESIQVDITMTAGDLIKQLLSQGDRGAKSALSPLYYSLRSASRWLTSEEKLGGLREAEVWLEPRTDLHQAAEEGSLQAAVSALKSCPVSAPDLRGDTALHLAMRKGHKRFVLKLLELPDCDPKLENAEGEAAIGENLDLSSCGIVRLPPTISQCHSLKTLDLSHNLLVTLPTDLVSLTRLKQLHLEGNPLPGIPADIVRGGASSVQEFLGNTSQETAWNRRKLVLCGPKRSGKTSIAHAFAVGSVRMTPRTAGIVTVEARVSSFECQIFDVCGDSFYAPAIPIFLSKRAAYCLVYRLDSAGSLQQIADDIAVQIRDINNATAGRSPIAIIGTHLDPIKVQGDFVKAVRNSTSPFGDQIVDESILVVNVTALSAAQSRLSSALNAVLERLPAEDYVVPRSFQSLHSYICSILARQKQSVFHKLTNPLLGSTMEHNAAHDIVGNRAGDQSPKLNGIVSRREFERIAADAFVQAGQQQAATEFLSDVGSILLAGDWVILDPASVASRIFDLFVLRGTTLDGVVPYKVLRALWPDIRDTVLPHLLVALRELNLIADFSDESFIFVPALVVPQKPSRTWPSSVFVPSYITEWRLTDCHVPERFCLNLLAQIAQFAPVETVWSRGIVIKASKLYIRVEAVNDPPTKIALTVTSKSSKWNPTVLAQWVHKLSSVVTSVLQATEFQSLKLERFVRALSMKKPALIRYADLLKFEEKGNKAVAVQGTSVKLELLMPRMPEEPLASTQAAPAAWLRAATIPHLVSCLEVCAETHRLVADMLAARGGISAADVPENSIGLHDALENFGLQTGAGMSGFDACRTIMIDRARSVLAALGAANWSSDGLQADLSKLLQMAGAIYASDLGLPMDEPSSQLLRSVTGKFGTTCLLLGKWVEETSALSAELRSRGSKLRSRVESLKALIDTAVTLEACLLLERTCASLGAFCKLLGNDIESSSSSMPAAVSESSAYLVTLTQLSTEQVACVCRLVEAGSLGRAAVLPLQSIPLIARDADESFEAFVAGSHKISQVERALRDVTHLNRDLATFLQPVVDQIGLKADDTVFARLLAMKQATTVVEQRHVAELIQAGGGSAAELMGLGKLAISAIADLVKASLQHVSLASSSPKATALQVFLRVDQSHVALLEGLVQSQDKSAKLLRAQRTIWNELLDECKSSPHIAVQTSFKLVFSRLENLWRSCELTSTGASGDPDFCSKYLKLKENLKDILLDVQIGIAADPTFEPTKWQQACVMMKDLLSSTVSTDRVVLFNECHGFCELVQQVALKGACSDCAGFVNTAIKFVAEFSALDASIFEMGFEPSSVQVRQRLLFLQNLVASLRQNAASVLKTQLSLDIPQLGSAAAAATINDKPMHLTAADVVLNLRLLHQFVVHSQAERTVRSAAELQSLVTSLFEDLSVIKAKVLADEKLPTLVAGLQKSLVAFARDVFNSGVADELLCGLGRVRDCVLGAKHMTLCHEALVQAWGAKSSCADAEALDSFDVPQYSRLLEAALGEVALEATHNPFCLAEKVLALIRAAGRAVLAMRAAEGSLKRCYGPYAVVYSASDGRLANVVQNYESGADRTLFLANAISLLCEGLERAHASGTDAAVGRRGMMVVRNALGKYAEAEQNAASFSSASAALCTALSETLPVKKDFALTVTLAEAGYEMEQLVSATRHLLLDGRNLLHQHTFSACRTRLESVLQGLLRELLRLQEQPAAPLRTSMLLGTSPASSPRESGIAKSPRTASPRAASPRSSSPASSPPRSPRIPSPSTSPRGTPPSQSPMPPRSPRDASSKSLLVAEEKTDKRSGAASTASESSDAGNGAAKASTDNSAAQGRHLSSSVKMDPEDTPKIAAKVEKPAVEASSSSLPSPVTDRKCRTIFKYNAKLEGELSFQRGDQIILDDTVDTTEAGIWTGRLESDGTSGSFNSKYVKLI